ncbi:hypothetical protein GCM10020331_013550 [Ectobacillus funiculus]
MILTKSNLVLQMLRKWFRNMLFAGQKGINNIRRNGMGTILCQVCGGTIEQFEDEKGNSALWTLLLEL